MMKLSSDDAYLFWIEGSVSEARRNEILKKLANLGVKFELITGLPTPILFTFNQKSKELNRLIGWSSQSCIRIRSKPYVTHEFL